jgi:alanine-glyoxylate transaminase / serine-glyoxylate transaminase / serine-pyruvate transaminase
LCESLENGSEKFFCFRGFVLSKEILMEQVLLTPGPTPIEPHAQKALSFPMRGHMDPEVFAVNTRVQTNLRSLYGTDQSAFTCLLAGTGSLGMEAGFANLLEPGDKVLICANGSFGFRMAEMSERLGARVSTVTAPIGQAVRLEDVKAALKHDAFKLVAVVHGETSTGVLNPAIEIAKLAKSYGALVTVDAVTTAGMMPYEMHQWGIDYAYTGSQKCLSAPPGVAPVAFSSTAIEAVHNRKKRVPLWYADLEGLQAYWDRREYHHTVPVQLHYALDAALTAALNEGLVARAERVEQVGAAALKALETIGFAAFVANPAERLPTVLAVRLPETVQDVPVRAALREHGVIVTGGLGETAGKIWRLGLMGESARPSVYHKFFAALEKVLGAKGLIAAFDQHLLVKR